MRELAPGYQLVLRWFHPQDYKAMVRIEEESYKHPWSERDFVIARKNQTTYIMIAEVCAVHDTPLVIGYGIYTLRSSKEDKKNDTVVIDNLTVAPGWRRMKVGSDILTRIQRLCRHKRRKSRFVVLTHETHIDAQLFLRRHGYRCTSIIRNHWNSPSEPAYRFVRIPGVVSNVLV